MNDYYIGFMAGGYIISSESNFPFGEDSIILTFGPLPLFKCHEMLYASKKGEFN